MNETLIFLMRLYLGVFFIGVAMALARRFWHKKEKPKEQTETEKFLTKVYTPEQVETIKREIKLIETLLSQKTEKTNSQLIKDCLTKNTICPKCKGDNITDRLKRIQGELKGRMSYSAYGGLLNSAFFGSGSINGKWDTNEVNKCNNPDCQHEWKKEILSTISFTKEDLLRSFRYFCKRLSEIRDCTFNSLDTSEKYSSLDEKKAALQKSLDNNDYYKLHAIDFLEGVSIDSIYAIAKQEYCHNYNKICYGWFLETCTVDLLKENGYREL